MEHVARLYKENNITLEKAAEEAGVSLWELMEYLRQQKIPWQYDIEDFERDIQGIHQRASN